MPKFVSMFVFYHMINCNISLEDNLIYKLHIALMWMLDGAHFSKSNMWRKNFSCSTYLFVFDKFLNTFRITPFQEANHWITLETDSVNYLSCLTTFYEPFCGRYCPICLETMLNIRSVAIGNPERHVRKASHRGSKHNRDHARNLSYYCLLVLQIWWCYSSRTSRSWWITQSTQHHRRGCNNIPSFLQRTTPIARSLCEGWAPHNLHILVTAPFCWSVSHSVNLIHAVLCDDEGVAQARAC